MILSCRKLPHKAMITTSVSKKWSYLMGLLNLESLAAPRNSERRRSGNIKGFGWWPLLPFLPPSLSSSANKSRSEGCPTEWRSDCVALEGGLQCKTSETPSSFAATTTGCILARHSLCSFVLLMQRAASTDPLCWAWYFVENGNVAICFCMLWSHRTGRGPRILFRSQ